MKKLFLEGSAGVGKTSLIRDLKAVAPCFGFKAECANSEIVNLLCSEFSLDHRDVLQSLSAQNHVTEVAMGYLKGLIDAKNSNREPRSENVVKLHDRTVISQFIYACTHAGGCSTSSQATFECKIRPQLEATSSSDIIRTIAQRDKFLDLKNSNNLMLIFTYDEEAEENEFIRDILARRGNVDKDFPSEHFKNTNKAFRWLFDLLDATGNLNVKLITVRKPGGDKKICKACETKLTGLGPGQVGRWYAISNGEVHHTFMTCTHALEELNFF